VQDVVWSYIYQPSGIERISVADILYPGETITFTKFIYFFMQ